VRGLLVGFLTRLLGILAVLAGVVLIWGRPRSASSS
jgi:hypothetical protein